MGLESVHPGCEVAMTPYVGPIETLAATNANFRQVVFTGKHTQLVLMCLQPGEDMIGARRASHGCRRKRYTWPSPVRSG